MKLNRIVLGEWLDKATFFPTFDDEGHTQKARTFRRIVLWKTVIIALFLLGLGVMEPPTMLRRAHSVGQLVVLFAFLLWLNRRGLTKLASWLLVLGPGLQITWRAYTSGGATVGTPAGVLFVYLCMVAGTLLGTRGGVIIACIYGSLGLWLAWMQQAGMLPPAEMTYTPISNWIYTCLALALSVVLHPQITYALRTSLARAQREVTARLEAEHRLRIALDAGSIGVWERDLSTGRLTVDQRLIDLYELVPSDDGSIAYDTWIRRVHPDYRAELQENFTALESGNVLRTQREFQILTPSGVTHHVFGAGSAVKNSKGEIVRIVGVNRDITARKRVEEERTSLVHDLGERVKELQLLHRVASLIHKTHSSDRALLREIVLRIPAAWQYPETCEARIAFRDFVVSTPGFQKSQWIQSKTFATNGEHGLIEIVYLEARPEHDEGPFLVEERALLDSLAELLVSHIELRRHHEQLEDLVSTRTREMQAAKEEAERASRYKSTFLATMSHEIRTPMNAILGYAQVLRRDRTLDVSQQGQVETIISSGEHLLSLINDVLDMSKIEAGRMELAPEVVDLVALLTDIEQMFATLARSKDLKLSFEISSKLPRLVSVDPGKLRQVVINLLSNAVKFTSDGSVTLRATLEREMPSVSHLKIAVQDTGSGIEEENLQRIFETFEQTTSGLRAGGTGLGLSIAKQLAKMMGGDLIAESREGEGSTFTFTFEAQTGPGIVRGEFPTRFVGKIAVEPGSRKVLVIDDVAENVALALSFFSTVGLEAQGALSGDEGIERFKSWKPDLVLVDLRMPGIGGIEILRILREHDQSVILVAFTASGLDDLVELAISSGADDVIFKPYRETEFIEKIAHLLGVDVFHEHEVPAELDSDASAKPSLTLLLESVPDALRRELHEAVVEARVQRVERIADAIDEISADAANQIRELVRDFRYDDLMHALTKSA